MGKVHKVNVCKCDIIIGVDKDPVGPVGQGAAQTYVVVNLRVISDWGLFFCSRQ
jgi:hypothetical protein